jgi:hypothetical protein
MFPEKEVHGHSPIFTFLCLWAIYISHDWSTYSPQEICGPIFGIYINCSQTHECGDLDWGRAIPRKGKHKWDFRCSVQSSIPRLSDYHGLSNIYNLGSSDFPRSLCFKWFCVPINILRLVYFIRKEFLKYGILFYRLSAKNSTNAPYKSRKKFRRKKLPEVWKYP